MKTATAVAGPLAHLTVNALCVFLCTALFDSPSEPYRASSVRQKHPKNLPEAPPEKPEIANKPIRKR